MFDRISPRPRTRPSIAAVLVCGALLAACGPTERIPRDAFVAAGLPGDRTLPAMAFPEARGDTFDLSADTDGRVTLLFLGYTHCPDVCPVHMSNLAAVLADLGPVVKRDVATVFVTADPARDSLARLEEWIEAIDRDFVALRPTREEVGALEDALGLPHSGFVAQPGSDDYLVGHAGQVIGFDRDGVARAAWPWGTRQRDWRRDLPRIVRGEWPEPEDTRIELAGAPTPDDSDSPSSSPESR